MEGECLVSKVSGCLDNSCSCLHFQHQTLDAEIKLYQQTVAEGGAVKSCFLMGLCTSYPSSPLQQKVWKLESSTYQETRIMQKGLQWHVSMWLSAFVQERGYFCPPPWSALSFCASTGVQAQQQVHEFVYLWHPPHDIHVVEYHSTTWYKVGLKYSSNWVWSYNCTSR